MILDLSIKTWKINEKYMYSACINNSILNWLFKKSYIKNTRQLNNSKLNMLGKTNRAYMIKKIATYFIDTYVKKNKQKTKKTKQVSEHRGHTILHMQCICPCSIGHCCSWWAIEGIHTNNDMEHCLHHPRNLNL